MRCTICGGVNTMLAERHLTLIFDIGGATVQGAVDDTWFCDDCHGTFLPATSRVERWNMPLRKKRKMSRYGIPKKWIMEELYRRVR